MTSQSFVFPDPGVPKVPIDRLDLYSDDALRYVQTSRPFVAKVDWPALSWTPESLRLRIGHGTVPVYERDGGKRVEITVSEFIDFVDTMRSGNLKYVAQNYPVIALVGREAKPEFASLLADIRLPPWVREDRINSAYLWLKNMGYYDNRSHAEPNACANLNLQVRGKKHVWLFPPEDARLLGTGSPREEMMTPPYFSVNQSVYSPADHPEFKNVRCYETVLEAGDILFIPTFWFHWFVHYDAYQINFNCWFYTDQIPLSPVAGEWAYMKALCVALGGFHVAPERFAALPIEIQDLLTAISRTLLTDPRITSTYDQRELYEGARRVEIDPELLSK